MYYIFINNRFNEWEFFKFDIFKEEKKIYKKYKI